jgi:adenosylhomocysteinase
MAEAAEKGDVFVTATGDVRVITVDHMLRMKDGAIVCNAGHFDVEVDVRGLRQVATHVRRLRPYVDEFTLPNGKRIFLLAEGRLVNLAAAEGHPAAVMDMSFANQALSVAYLAHHTHELSKDVHPVPRELDEEVARLKLASMGIRIDTLTPEQQRYLSSWEEGTE